MSDRLQERLFEIALALLEEAGYLTLEGLAQRAGVSKRTVQHDLERLEAWLEDEGLSERITLVKKSGSGVCLVCTDESKKFEADPCRQFIFRIVRQPFAEEPDQRQL